MNSRTLILRSLRFHARAHLGVVLGAMVGSSALIGALIVGDSVRGSLREMALQRLGWVDAAMAPHDRFFTQGLAERLSSTNSALKARINALLMLPGTAARQDGNARANQVKVLGVTPEFWQGRNTNAPGAFMDIPKGGVVLNEALASQLRAIPGDDLVLRLHKPSALSRDVPITPQSEMSIALRLKVHAIAPAAQMGNFSLQANQTPPLNAFLNRDDLAVAAGLTNRANVLVAGKFGTMHGPLLNQNPLQAWLRSLAARRQGKKAGDFNESLTKWVHPSASLADYNLQLHPTTNSEAVEVELSTGRIFLEPSAASAVQHPLTTSARPLLTYLVNLIRAGEHSAPYSMVTAAGAPWTPSDLANDEIIINQWLADDLKVAAGGTVELTYFLPESGSRLVERTNRFRIRSVVPLAGVHSDRTLMPEFPGLAKAESTHEWDAGFPLVHKIRDQDEQYWKDHRGTPKAFISLAAGQALWGNRFGNLTALRLPVPPGQDSAVFREMVERSLLSQIDPDSLGLRFEPVRSQALAAANQAQDFGQLFLGFSFFLIIAALILMALLFQFGLEQRSTEIGTLLAVGFTPKQVRRLLLREGMGLALVGGLLGALAGSAFARAMLHGLTTIWRDAVGTSALSYHVTPASIIIGVAASVLVSALTIALVLRNQAKRPARELLAEGAEERRWPKDGKWKRSRAGVITAASAAAAAGLIGWALWNRETAAAGVFFGAGALLLIAGLAWTAALLSSLARAGAGQTLSVRSLGFRGATRRRKRSLATVSLLACGTFLIVAIGAFKLDAGRDASKRSSGTGGFALIGQASLPVVHDLNTKPGREFFGLDEEPLQGVDVIPMRVRDGDDASCLNLNRAQTPRLLGVNPDSLATRFTFVKAARGFSVASGWQLLEKSSDAAIPAIGDQNSILWALGKKVGDTLDLVDEKGRPFKVQLVAAVANSILQGSLLISEEAFLEKFPGESGYRMFLVDAPSNRVSAVAATLTRALQNVGLELTPATRRLAEFNAVQNTYLNTFQVLGGLGLLLGSAGLGVVVLRNVLERRGELALLQAVGFRRRTLHRLVLSEHSGLLWLGLAVGIVAALVAILPVLLAPGAQVNYASLGGTLAAIFASGLLWTWLATRFALRGELLKALRNE